MNTIDPNEIIFKLRSDLERTEALEACHKVAQMNELAEQKAELEEARHKLEILTMAGFTPYFEDGRLVGYKHQNHIYKAYPEDLEAYYEKRGRG